LESAEASERSSSRTGKPPPRFVESQEEEKIEGPKALESPPVGSVSDPDLRRLWGTEVLAWRMVGRVAVAAAVGLGATDWFGVNSWLAGVLWSVDA
jgi:hypothetical protein